MSYTVGDIPGGSSVWLLQIGGTPPDAVTRRQIRAPGFFRPGVGPIAAADATSTAPIYRFSDRGWIGTPSDADQPNKAFLPRLAAPVAIDQTISPLPEQARGSISVGEISLQNGDGLMAELGGDWSIAGRSATILRGPYRSPTPAAYSSFAQVASLRVTGPAYGETTLRLPVTDSKADLSVPACNVYAGTGGIDGNSTLVGQFKPCALGRVQNMRPILLDSGTLLYHVHDGQCAAISAVRDRGVALTFSADYATLAALNAASPSAGSYATCIAQGCFRLGAAPAGQLTADVLGDGASATGGYTASLFGLVWKLLEGPGGISSAQWVTGGFNTWPGGDCGLLLTGGTVADAMDRVARAAAGWWGTDATGRVIGGRAVAPSSVAASGTIRILAGRAQQVQPVPPRWRVRVGYDVIETVQPPAELAGGVTNAARDRLGIPARYATAIDLAVLTAYPAAIDPDPAPALFAYQADAAALAATLQALHGTPRQTWMLPLRRWDGSIAIGQSWRVEATGAERLAGRDWLVIGIQIRGDAQTIIVWG